MPIIPVAEWAPDQPDLADFTNVATNVVALTGESYGPLLALVPFSSNQIEGVCLGMGFGEDSAGNNHTFVGTATHLEILTSGSTTWTDVSGTTYGLTGNNTWHFAQYNNLMLATDFADPIQTFNMISSTHFSNLASAAPLARYIAVAKTFAIVANTYDPVSGFVPERIWWSATGDPTNWPTPGSPTAIADQSDYNDIVGPMGAVTGLATNLAGCDCAVFFERGVFNMFYVGPPNIFDFYPGANVRGCPCPNSIVSLGSTVYFRGEDGFYSYDGSQAVPIGAGEVDKWFQGIVDQSALHLVIGAPDIQNKTIGWLFRSVYAPTTQPDQIVMYRWDIQRWTSGVISTQWICRAPATEALSALSIVQGQLQLAAISGSTSLPLAPLLTETLSDILTEASVAIDVESSGAYYLSYFSGQPLSAQVGTKAMQINPGYRTFVSDHVRPLVNSALTPANLQTENTLYILTEFGVPLSTEASSAVITVAMSARNNYYDQEIFGSEVSPNVMGDCPQRSDGRYHRGRISIPSGVWSTMFGLDVNGIRAGQR